MSGSFDPETDVCNKCMKICDEKWQRGKTWEGIDKHHNPPEFISDFFNEEWSGKFYNLCRKCHVDLHKEIKQILFAHSNSLNFINSESWLMKKMTPSQIRESQKQIYEFTKEWIKKNDTKTTTTI